MGKRRLAGLGVLAFMVALVVLFVQAGSAADEGGGEVWAPAQDTGTLYVVHGMGSVEAVTAPGAIQNPHLINFSPSGDYAYVSDVGNGNLNVVRASHRAVLAPVTFGTGTDTHQAKPSPDGSILLVARRAPGSTPLLHKVLANEAAESWTVTGQTASFGGKSPICTIFRDDGARAYVSLSGSGIAVVDVASMSVLNTLTTNGAVACGMVKSRDGSTVYVTSNGGAGSPVGYFYRLSTATDTLSPPTPVSGTDVHFLGLSPNGKTAYATARGSEALKILDTAGTTIGTVLLDPTPGPLNDQPDGVAVKGDNVYVALKNAGKLAIVKGKQQTVDYLQLATASSNALPHVTVRP
jgi:DNA-binding beta-propeller fold protein YncE